MYIDMFSYRSFSLIGDARPPLGCRKLQQVRPLGESPHQHYSTTDIPYQLLGGIIHIGDRAHTGHYRMFEVRNMFSESDQLYAEDLIMHENNIQPVPAAHANLVQIHHNAYMLLFRKI